MSDERFSRLRILLIQATDLPADARRALLERACADDAELRRDVERLLAYDAPDDELTELAAALRDVLSAKPAERRPEAEVSTVTYTRDGTLESVGTYEILRVIGAGGMGTVYQARQSNPRRIVALKMMKGSLTEPATVRRFRFETEILARLNHPGIARVYEAGEAEGGLPFFAMELVRGKTLVRHAEDHALDTRERLGLMAQVCDAVHYAHDAGVIHRDLKPANILVTEETGTGPQPKILDFGVARATHAGFHPATLHTMTGQLVGTLAYMSPEQVTGRPEQLDVRSDVYQLGMVLYELLAGRLPYSASGNSVPESIRVILEEEPPPLRLTNPACKGDVESIVGKALSKERDRRYESAAALAADIRRHLADEPIIARPASGFYRLRKAAKRNKDRLAGLGAGLLVVLVVLLVLWSRPSESPGEGPVATQLTALPDEIGILGAAISPNGRTLAFIDSRGVFLQDIASKEVTPLAGSEDLLSHWKIRWHPTKHAPIVAGHDSTGLDLWLISENGGRSRLIDELETTDGSSPLPSERVRSGRQEVLFPADDLRDFRVSPDGTKLLVQTTPSGGHVEKLSIYTHGGVRKDLVLGEGRVSSPVWSPGGAAIAFIRHSGSKFSLETVTLAGDRRVVVDTGDASPRAGYYSTVPRTCWLADGRLFYTRSIESTTAADTELWALPVDPATGARRGTPRRIAGWAASAVLHPSASANGDRLAFLRMHFQREVFEAELTAQGQLATAPRRLTFDERNDTPITWSRDGKSLFIDSNRHGSSDVLILGEGEPIPRLFVGGPDEDSSICLTPDGDSLLVRRGGSAGRTLLIVPLSGQAEPRAVPYPRPGVIACARVADGPCVFGRLSAGTLTFYRLGADWKPDLELGHLEIGEEHTSRRSFSQWSMSPDGRTIAVVTRSRASPPRSQIHFMDVASGHWREALEVEGLGLQRITFAPDGQSLYATGMPWRLARVSLSGDVEILWGEEAPGWLHQPTVSPDGSRIAFAMLLHDEDVWMLEEF